MEGLRFHKLYHLGLVLLLAKLSPHAVIHSFSQRTRSRVKFDCGGHLDEFLREPRRHGRRLGVVLE